LYETLKTGVTPENQAKINYDKPTEFSQCRHNQMKEHQRLSVTMVVTSAAMKAFFEVVLCTMIAKKPNTIAEGLFCHMLYTGERALGQHMVRCVPFLFEIILSIIKFLQYKIK
jgi:hypothetical protein